MGKTKGRKPDYNVSVLNKATEQRGPVGVGWLNEDGSISISLNMCVILRSDPDLVINVFPVTKWEEKKPSPDRSDEA